MRLMAGGRGCSVNSVLLKVMGAGLALCIVCGGVYYMGYSHAEAKGDAALNALNVEREEERRAAAEEYGKALAERLEKYQREVAAAQGLASKLATEKSKLDAQVRSLKGQIHEATATSNHVFNTHFVRLWNAFTGADDAATMPAPGGAGGTVGAGSTSAATYTGISGVNEEDVLEFMAYYGSRCRNLEAKERAWIDLSKGWAQ